jgi:hypothetical protein
MTKKNFFVTGQKKFQEERVTDEVLQKVAFVNSLVFIQICLST